MAETRGSDKAIGISNRETPAEEAEERREHPPTGANARTRRPSSAADEPDLGNADQQATSKRGLHSTAEKESDAI